MALADDDSPSTQGSVASLPYGQPNLMPATANTAPWVILMPDSIGLVTALPVTYMSRLMQLGGHYLWYFGSMRAASVFRYRTAPTDLVSGHLNSELSPHM